MLEILKHIREPKDIKTLGYDELNQLSAEIRTFLIQSLSRTGGHLASNLGVVELTLAMHYVFDSPQDKMIWDVGHQAYVHKLLTGRRKDFKNLRMLGGMSGFPKRCESEHDAFETGHSSTSISAALGMAKSRDLRGDNNKVIAVIGDGALTGGMAFEALNNAGRGNTNLIVVLNDNEMSISKNVGGMGAYLNKLRSSKDYLKVKEDVEDVLHRVPIMGEQMVSVVKSAKESVKRVVIQSTIFEQLGFNYIGPVDGQNLPELIQIFENAKNMRGPILIHVKTKKGKGYLAAEQRPSEYHGVGPFCISTGKSDKKSDNMTFSQGFSNAIMNIAKVNNKVVGITAAMPDGTGLMEFANQYPRRFFDVGIAEQHAVTFAAGLAIDGHIPVVAVYSSFLQRAYDQILHDVCLQNLPVIFAVDRAGLVGEDGPTHHGLYDISFLTGMPNMTILAPKTPNEIEAAMNYAISLNSPVAIRYPRGGSCIEDKYENTYEDICFKTLKEGNNIAILAVGRMVEQAISVSEKLNELGIDSAVIEAPCVWPIKDEEINGITSKYNYLFTMEDGIIQGGFGEKIFAKLGVIKSDITGKIFGFRNGLVTHGKVELLFEQEGMDVNGITKSIQEIINNK